MLLCEHKGEAAASWAGQLLAGFSVESLLKSFLAQSGLSEKELKQHKLRHNLLALWELACEHGLDPCLNEEESRTLNLLNDTHTSHDQRYAGGGKNGWRMNAPTQNLALIQTIEEKFLRAKGVMVGSVFYFRMLTLTR
jgi:hypothetical protein